MANDTIQVTIQTPKKMLYKGPALAVSSVNSTGKFDILAEHANFITIIQKTPVEVLTLDHKKLFFTFNEAIVYNSQNKVSVFAEPSTSVLDDKK
jgi:F0F1-type ATP synthase epsilon subunit